MISGILILLAVVIFGPMLLWSIIEFFSMNELNRYVKETDRKIRLVELERLKRLPTRSRITNRPDI